MLGRRDSRKWILSAAVATTAGRVAKEATTIREAEKRATDRLRTGLTYPIAEYEHFGSVGNGIACGPFAAPGLSVSGLLFSDFPTGRIYYLPAPRAPVELRLRGDGVEQTFLEMIHDSVPDADRADLRLGRDYQGDVYLLNKQDGLIRKLVPSLEPLYQPDAAILVGNRVLGRGIATPDGTGQTITRSLLPGSFTVITFEINVDNKDTAVANFNEGNGRSYERLYSGGLAESAIVKFRPRHGSQQTITITFTSQMDPAKSDVIKLVLKAP
jgi:hypothetical protein